MVSHWVKLVVCTWLLLYGSLFLFCLECFK